MAPPRSQLAPTRARSRGRLLASPHELRGYHIVPDDADYRAGKTRHPPFLGIDEQPVAHADIGDQARHRDPVETQQAAQEGEAAQAAVAIGERVVDGEI